MPYFSSDCADILYTLIRLGDVYVKKNNLNIKPVLRRLYFGFIYSYPVIAVAAFLWIVGYDFSELQYIFIWMAIMFFFMGSAVPLKSFEIDRHDISIDVLRNRIMEENSKSERGKDILELMLSNMSELKQYYSISKLQARFAFVLAVLFCVTGTIILLISILKFDGSNLQSTIISAIGGTISEFFAGTSLLVYKSTLQQLNLYYKSLHENERFLSIVNLANQLPDDRQTDAFIKIIDSSLKDISSWIESER